jgi:hypothetical protein
MPRVHYFAFGSNMLSARLTARTDSARPLGLARLPGWRLAFHKRGTDDSGKCDIRPGDDGDEVVGVVFEMDADQLTVLDRFEGAGYVRTGIDVPQAGARLHCAVYRATDDSIEPDLKPFDWYHRLVLAGLLEHGAEPAYIERVRRVPWMDDPQPERGARRLALDALAAFDRRFPDLAPLLAPAG